MRVEALLGAEMAAADVALDPKRRNDGGGFASWATAETDRPFVGSEGGPAAAAAVVGGAVVVGRAIHTGGWRKPGDVALARHIAVEDVDQLILFIFLPKGPDPFPLSLLDVTPIAVNAEVMTASSLNTLYTQKVQHPTLGWTVSVGVTKRSDRTGK